MNKKETNETETKTEGKMNWKKSRRTKLEVELEAELAEPLPPCGLDYIKHYGDYELQDSFLPDIPWKEMSMEEQLEYFTRPFPWDSHVDLVNKEVFNNSKFLPFQREAVNAVLAKQDLLLCLPSGGGKSLIYQLSSLVTKGVTVVVSPLVSLVDDQIERLRQVGIPSRNTTSTGVLQENHLLPVYEEMLEPEVPFKVLFVTPEKLAKSRILIKAMKEMYKNGNLQALAVDEAHCISEWGHDFRPDYRKIGLFKKKFPGVPILGLTGTCTPEVREDIISQLQMKNHVYFQDKHDRPNIWIGVADRSVTTSLEEVGEELADFIEKQNLENETGIIYCPTKLEAENISTFLNERGLPSLPYHSKLPKNVRKESQEKWMKNEIKILCSTVAFGLGINKPDVRFVLHSCLPTSVEAYYQQVGRAGRDGKRSVAMMFYNPSDVHRVCKIIQQKEEEGVGSNSIEIDKEFMDRKLEKLDDIAAFSEARGCRREWLFSYFGEDHKCSVYKTEETCDYCLRKRRDDKNREERDARMIKRQHALDRTYLDGKEFGTEEAQSSRKFSKPSPSRSNSLNSDPFGFSEPAKASSPSYMPPSRLRKAVFTPKIDPKKRILSEPTDRITYEPTNRIASIKRKTTPKPTNSISETTKRSVSFADILNVEASKKDYVKEVTELDSKGILSKTAIRAIARERPTTLEELENIKGVGKQKSFMLKDKILPFFQEINESTE
eukprot:TRINITY_DN2296_c0_g1_i7.p1 TRINITY_DN2296_c0_g1~~TRINITY_DN2296_c0_g1_i7.p1  ORF type:complete len:721 (+),score=151.58 TRINITY_DN2296_c0_g1_i7:1728-3890(+)